MRIALSNGGGIPHFVRSGAPPIVVPAASISSVSIVGGPNFVTDTDIKVQFSLSDAVTVQGASTCPVTIGANQRQLTYLSGSGTSALVYKYSVTPSDSATNAQVSVASPVTLNGATISFTPPNTSTTTVNTVNTYSGSSITKVAFDKKVYHWSDSAGSTPPTISVTFSGEVSWTGSPCLILNDANVPAYVASCITPSPATTLQFQVYFSGPDSYQTGDSFGVNGLHWGNAATRATNLFSFNNTALLFTAATAGSAGNNVTVSVGAVMHVDGTSDSGYRTTASQPLVVSVSGSAITITAATDASGNLTTTKAQLVAAYAASAPAMALATLSFVTELNKSPIGDSDVIALANVQGYPANPQNLGGGYSAFNGNGITSTPGNTAPTFAFTAGGTPVVTFGTALPDISDIQLLPNLQASWNVTQISYAANTHGIMSILFPEPVFVTGVPQVNITLQGDLATYATYASGSGTNTLTFDYYGDPAKVATSYSQLGLPYANASVSFSGTNGGGPYQIQMDAGWQYGGASGNQVQYRWLAGVSNQAFSLDSSVTPFVDVRLATNGAGVVTTTYQDLIDAFQNDSNASGWINAYVNTGDGSSAVVPTSGPNPHNLTGGADDTSQWTPFTSGAKITVADGSDFAPLNLVLISPNAMPQVVA